MLSFMLDSRILRGLFRRAGSVRVNGNSADKTLIVSQAFAEDNYALVRDLILANILGMIPAPHLDHHHDLAKLAIDGHVPQPDNVIGEERNGVGAERKFSERLIHFKRAENRHPDSR